MAYEWEDGGESSARRVGLPAFVRIGGAIWLGLIAVVMVAAFLAPHAGRLLDIGLHQTSHRGWTSIQLQPDTLFFDLSTPIRTVRSYYSALNRIDTEHMDHLTHGPFRQQMQQRLARAEPVSESALYRSYMMVEQEEDTRALVLEKFHLFWQRGLRFSLLKVTATEWRIMRLAVVP